MRRVFCIPAKFERRFLERLEENERYKNVCEVYFSQPKTMVGHGRPHNKIKMGDLIIRHHFLDGTTGVVLHTRNKYFYFYNGWIDLWSGERSVKKRMETAVRRTEDM